MINKKTLYTASGLFKTIMKKLKEEKRVPDFLEYAIPTRNKYEFRNYAFDILGTVNFGSNEGIYIDVFFRGDIGDSNISSGSMGTIKTLNRDEDSFYRMAELMAAFQLAANTFVNEHLDDFTWTGFDIYYLKAGENQPKCGFTCSGLKTKNEAIKRACELFPTDPRYVEAIIINNANNDKYQFSREEFTHLTSEQLAAKKRKSEE